MPTTDRIRIFYSYAHEDEPFLKELDKHLSLLKRKGVIESWHDLQIRAGVPWEKTIHNKLRKAQVVLLLVSSDFLASDYCYNKEMTWALKQHENGSTRVIPILLRPVDWSDSPFSHLQALPKNAKPVATWPNSDEAWLDIVKGITLACEEIKQAAPRGNVSKTGSGIQIRCLPNRYFSDQDSWVNYSPHCKVNKKGKSIKEFTLSWTQPTIIPLKSNIDYHIEAYISVPLGSTNHIEIECNVKDNEILYYTFEAARGNRPTLFLPDE
jgi:hypothetical protein